MNIAIRVLLCEVAIDIVHGLEGAVSSLAHDGLDIPPKVETEGDVRVTEAMHPDEGKAMLLAQGVDVPVERGRVRCN